MQQLPLTVCSPSLEVSHPRERSQRTSCLAGSSLLVLPAVCCECLLYLAPCSPATMNANDVENDHFLEEALKSVKKHAWHMKRAMDLDNLKDVLQHAADMLYELRTSRLTPRNYYRLYMDIADELMVLEHFFSDMHRKGTPMEDLYRMVQHAGNVLPRLYLLVTAGSVYIQSKEAPAKDILKDVVEMAKGVQQPMRGLFLRNYISHMTKNKLPDVDNEYEGDGGSVQHSVDFVLQNFSEMNKLWVRMQYQRTHAKSKREKQRRELKVLVGTNLRRLSDLEGINVEYYKTGVLPRILEQVISCKDAIAQDYLMEIIIQVFPSEFHLATLEQFLSACKVRLQLPLIRACILSAIAVASHSVLTICIACLRFLQNAGSQGLRERERHRLQSHGPAVDIPVFRRQHWSE